jgi:hypothetical protein
MHQCLAVERRREQPLDRDHGGHVVADLIQRRCGVGVGKRARFAQVGLLPQDWDRLDGGDQDCRSRHGERILLTRDLAVPAVCTDSGGARGTTVQRQLPSAPAALPSPPSVTAFTAGRGGRDAARDNPDRFTPISDRPPFCCQIVHADNADA